MIKIEEDLANFLLNLARGPWTQQYNRESLELWRTTYGDQVADKIEVLVKSQWKK